MLTKEGGRRILLGYTPQFYFRTTDVTGKLDLIGAEMCMPGDNVQMAMTWGQAHRNGSWFDLRYP